MFAALIFDRDPLQWSDLPPGLMLWVQVTGGVAAFALLLWFLVGLPRTRKEDLESVPPLQKTLFVGATLLSWLCYLIFFVFVLSGSASDPTGAAQTLRDRKSSTFLTSLRDNFPAVLQTLAGASALFAVALPFFSSFGVLRFRRISALSRLSFKEAIRRRILYAFSGMLLVFLFGSWFIPSMPKDQVRTYVSVVFDAMRYLLLFTTVLLAAFSLPNDIKQQTIHTIVTKPVERFEVVLGRFLGFLGLMTMVLLVMTAISLLYVVRGVHPAAAAESLKARVPLYGELFFENTERADKATNVGREWEYRSYITRPPEGGRPQTARWDFASLPNSLGSRPEVLCEYTFDIYRTTKGHEGHDVKCKATFSRPGANAVEFRKERDAAKKNRRFTAEVADKLSEKHGYYEIETVQVTDYHTQSLMLPGGLFRYAPSQAEESGGRKQRGSPSQAQLQVRVTCEDATQYVGMARYDFYVRLDEPGAGEQWLFAMNFFKGAFGLWLQVALIIGVAVVLSTYLNGVISLMVTLLLFVGGWSRDFVESVALAKNAGGGPTESMVRIFRRELTGASFEDSTSISDQLVSRSDDAFRWLIKRLIHAIPDVNQFDLKAYVAEGFNISATQMTLDFLLLAGYLVPWGLLGFYLMRWREIAGPL